MCCAARESAILAQRDPICGKLMTESLPTTVAIEHRSDADLSAGAGHTILPTISAYHTLHYLLGHGY